MSVPKSKMKKNFYKVHYEEEEEVENDFLIDTERYLRFINQHPIGEEKINFLVFYWELIMYLNVFFQMHILNFFNLLGLAMRRAATHTSARSAP